MRILTLNPLKWKIWGAPNNASKLQVGFTSSFRGLKLGRLCLKMQYTKLPTALFAFFLKIGVEGKIVD